MSGVASARLRLVQQLAHLAASLNITVAGNEGIMDFFEKKCILSFSKKQEGEFDQNSTERSCDTK